MGLISQLQMFLKSLSLRWRFQASLTTEISGQDWILPGRIGRRGRRATRTTLPYLRSIGWQQVRPLIPEQDLELGETPDASAIGESGWQSLKIQRKERVFEQYFLNERANLQFFLICNEWGYQLYEPDLAARIVVRLHLAWYKFLVQAARIRHHIGRILAPA